MIVNTQQHNSFINLSFYIRLNFNFSLIMENSNDPVHQTSTHNPTVAESAISNDVDIHQKRTILQDPTKPKEYLITCILIYVAQYYPRTKILLNKLINKLTFENQQKNIELLYNCSSLLSQDVLRQIIYGPSTTFIPPSEIGHINRNDTSLAFTETSKTISIHDLLTVHEELNLEEVIPKSRVHELIFYTRSKTLSNKLIVNNRYSSKQLRNQLQISGQNWLDATPLASLFIVLKHLWREMLSKLQNYEQNLVFTQKIRLLYARYSFLHNKILVNPVKELADDVFHNYETYIKKMFDPKIKESTTANQYVRILIEYSYCLLFYYKYKKCEKIISNCCELLELELEYTGKLGRRTKYQSFDCAQLIMNLKKRKNEQQSEAQLTKDDQQEDQQAQRLIFPDAKKLIMEEIDKTTKQNPNDNIKQSFYDEDNILLERPKITEIQSQENQETFIITKQKIITVIAMVNYTYSSVPHDEMLFQYISTSINTILENKGILDFSLQFTVLLLRSFNEFSRVKYVERAIQQLETLKSQYEIKEHKNVDLIFSTPYLTRMEFVMKFAHRYMDIQMVLTAVNLLKQAGMYQQCVDGLIQRNYKEKALQLVNQIIEQKGKTPRLLCMLGDIHHNDPAYYQQAWNLSEKKYGRAMRSLGWVYFNKEDFSKAAECFTYATEVSYYNPNTWFTLGCCYIRMQKFEKALRPFGQSVRIDETQGQAWGNIASCYIQLKKMKQAYSTLEQAVKHAEGNWKLWSNFLSVSISLKQFFKFFDCIEKLVQLNHSQVLTQQTLNKIHQVMQFKLYEAVDGKCRKRIAYNFKNRIDRLFRFLCEKIGQNPLIWEAKVQYLEVMLEYVVEMYKYYRKLHKENSIDPNDLIDGYETERATHDTTIVETSFYKQMIIEAKQNQLNMSMKIGWEENKIQSSKVLNVLKQYIQIYKKYNTNKDDVTEFQLFVKGLKNKLQKSLQTQINLPI